jgi:uncharacterized protein YgfB (UPF0149 family)
LPIANSRPLVSASQTDYHRLDEFLHRAGVPIALPELHGGLCGSLAALGAAGAEGWIEACLRGADLAPGSPREVPGLLDELQAETWQALTGIEMSFEPLIPADDATLAERVHALALWCHGFLAGLGLGGLELSGLSPGVSEQLREIMEDLSEISRATLGADESADIEQAAFAFEEVKEYVRISAQLVFDELEEVRKRESGDATVH